MDGWNWSLAGGLITAVVVGGCSQSPEAARKQLAGFGVEYTAEAFLKAVAEGDEAVVPLFIAAGMDANTEDAAGTALEEAVQSGRIETIDLLLKAGANPNNGTSLSLALQQGDTVIAERLVAAGASVNYALHQAVGERDVPSVEWLLERGADPSAAFDGSSPLVMAVARRDRELALLLIRKETVGARVFGGSTALHAAVDDDFGVPDLVVIQGLLEAGADPNRMNDEGQTPLDIAATAHRPHEALVSLLNEFGGAP